MANRLRRGRPPKKDGKSSTKSKKSYYFTKDTELAIIAWQRTDSFLEKEEIFVEEIQPAFAKLIQNLIFVYKFNKGEDIDTLSNDCMSALYESLGKFNAEKGHAAFSYYNVIGRNWFIQRSKVRQKRAMADIPFDNVLLTELENNSHEAVVSSHDDTLIDNEFLDYIKQEIKSWKGKFNKTQELKVLEAVILLLENPDIISIHNKKGIYLYLREICSLSTKQIVTNLQKFRKKYYNSKKKWLSGDM